MPDQKKLTPPRGILKKISLPAIIRSQLPSGIINNVVGGKKTKLPNASIVYGIAASAFFVIAICLLFAGKWFSALMVFLLGACFLGYAVHFIKNH